MAQEIITSFPILTEVPVEGDLSFQPTGTTGFAKEFRGDVYTSRGRFGNGSAYVDISAVSIKSNNFVSGSAGWQILYSGDVELNSGTFRGSLEASSIHIPSITAVNSFHTDSDGNSWWGSPNRATANAYVLNTGEANFSNALIIGTSDIIIDTLDTDSKKILSDFNFGTTDYAGALKAGDITWNTTTGAITGGSGVAIYRGGIVGAKAGVATFTIDAGTGDATFAGTLSAAGGTLGTITAGTITGVSLDIGTPTHYFTVTTSGVTVIRYQAAAGNLVTVSQTDVQLGGAPTSKISFDTAITDITRLSLTRNTSSSTSNTLIVFTDAGTTSNSAKLLALTSASTGIGLDISKTGDGVGINLAQSGAATGFQLTQTGLGNAIRIDFNYTASEASPFLIVNANVGVCMALFANNNGAHIRLAGDPTVSSPVDGDIWFDGSELKIRIGATTYNLNKTAV